MSILPCKVVLCLGGYSFIFYFTPWVLFTLSFQYYFTINHPGLFNLAWWSLLIHMRFHVSHVTRVRAQASDAFACWTLAI
ncbi:hypothetical protein ACFXTH_043114 [Malus domestica]